MLRKGSTPTGSRKNLSDDDFDPISTVNKNSLQDKLFIAMRLDSSAFPFSTPPMDSPQRRVQEPVEAVRPPLQVRRRTKRTDIDEP